MVFSSLLFVFLFLTLNLVCYYSVKTIRQKNIVLLVFSLIFYAWGGAAYLLLLAGMAFWSWLCALMIQKNEEQKTRKLWMWAECLVLLGLLIFFKYMNFLTGNLSALIGFPKEATKIILPIGISFYTFQLLSYVVDVYRKEVAAQPAYWKLLLYCSLFHQCIAGPIVRYQTVASEIDDRKVTLTDLTNGIRRFSIGLAKKAILANGCASVADTLLANTQSATTAGLWLGMLFYMLQIYLDFSAYSDMAIGMGQMVGFHYLENFNYPYSSVSVQDFWRRWHITLCAWFKDYLFYPLSMSKWMNKVSRWLKKHVGKPVGSRFPVYFSSLTVWFVTGIWHGASWNFVVWGLLNSIIMLVSQELKPLYEKADNRLGYRKLKYYKVFEIIRTTAIVCCLQMLDYYRDIAEAFRMFFSMFTSVNYVAVFTKGMWSIGLSAADYIVIFAGVVIMFVVSLLERKCPVRDRLAKKNYIIRYTVFLVIFLLIAVFGIYGTGYESSQFIYNQF